MSEASLHILRAPGLRSPAQQSTQPDGANAICYTRYKPTRKVTNPMQTEAQTPVKHAALSRSNAHFSSYRAIADLVGRVAPSRADWIPVELRKSQLSARDGATRPTNPNC